MADLAVDARTVLRLLEDGRPAVHRLVGTSALRSQVPDLLLAAVRGERLPEDRALALQDDLTTLRVRLLGARASRRSAWRLATEHGWSAADAEVVAVARLQADALVTVGPRCAPRRRAWCTLEPFELLTTPDP